MYNDGDTFRSFSHQIGCLLKYIEFNHAWHKEGTMSVNKLIYAIKRNLVDRYGKYFISVITKNTKLQTYGKFLAKAKRSVSKIIYLQI